MIDEFDERRLPNQAANIALRDSVLASDDALYARFCARSRRFFLYISVVYLILVLAFASGGASIVFSFLNLFLWSVAFGLIWQIRDPMIYFLVTHPAWMFSFTAYAWSALALKPVEQGLYGPVQSISITVVYQAGCLFAFVLYLAFSRLRFTKRAQRVRSKREGGVTALRPFRVILVLIGVGFVSLSLVVQDPTLSALAGQVQAFIWLGGGLHILDRKGLRFDTFNIGFTSLFVVLALSSNFRSLLMSCGIFYALTFVYYAKHIMRPAGIAIALLLLNVMMVFSSISIDIRLAGGRESSRSLVEQYAEKLFTADTALALVDPFYEHPAAEQIKHFADAAFGQDRFDMPFFGDSGALGTRFIILPLMDVVCGQYGAIERVRWDQLANLVLSSLPNVGQQKELWYGDRVTWELGLRDWGNIGAPMITNACELYTMSGWLGMFVVTSLEFLAILLWYRLMKRVLEYYYLTLCVFAQMIIYIAVTTTSLSEAGLAIRGLPFTIGLVWLAKSIASASFGRTGANRMSSSGAEAT